jgi:hypothetical protein
VIFSDGLRCWSPKCAPGRVCSKIGQIAGSTAGGIQHTLLGGINILCGFVSARRFSSVSPWLTTSHAAAASTHHHMEPVFNCFGCGCIPQSMQSQAAEKPQVSLDAAPRAHTVLHTRFSRLRPVTLHLQRTGQPFSRRGLSSATLDTSNDEAERQKWTTRKQSVLSHARARMHPHTKGADTAHRQRNKKNMRGLSSVTLRETV